VENGGKRLYDAWFICRSPLPSDARVAFRMNNNRALFVASFLTLIAAGFGFAVRGAILGDWGTQFDFTKQELGTITGMGFVGGGIAIIVFSMFTDKVGYKAILIGAFVLHALSAVVTLAATPVHSALGKNATYYCLYWGMFMFSLANGLCETAINPLVATLYQRQKTHYLNMLHAGWPGGLILGGVIAYLFCGSKPFITHIPWEVAIGLFLIPTLIYGVIVLKEKFPISEARAAGVSFGTMLLEFVSPLLLLLLVLHGMVGYVELGTDSWVQNIMNNVVGEKAFLLFVYMSALMFILRFFAGPIVEKINPIGLLFIASIVACIGLTGLGYGNAGLAVLAAGTIYAAGKTFFWATMLGVVGERFPKGGAVTMGTVGGIGMLSAGLLGGPGIGYVQDKYASEKLKQESASVYEQYAAKDESHFLLFKPIKGLDGKKVGELMDKVDGKQKLTPAEQADAKPVEEARLYGGQMALRKTALVPAVMAIGYLVLLIYFRFKGGYRAEVLHGAPLEGEKYAGGIEAPVE
jgi:fucose permease